MTFDLDTTFEGMKDRAQQSTQELRLGYGIAIHPKNKKTSLGPVYYLQYLDLYFATLIVMLEIGIKEKGYIL